jgi:hypothetical protein
VVHFANGWSDRVLLAGLPYGIISYQKLNLAKFERDFEWIFWYIYGHLEYFMAICHLHTYVVYFVVILYFSNFGMLNQEKSGNPDNEHFTYSSTVHNICSANADYTTYVLFLNSCVAYLDIITCD